MEDAVDVLTLKDDESVENYATALHLLAHAEVGHVFMARFHEIEDYRTQGHPRHEENIIIQKSVVQDI